MRTATRIAALGLVLELGIPSPHVFGEAQRQSENRPTRPVGETVQLAGLDCSVWTPVGARGRVPLVIFSHGFHGNRNQSTFLTNALAAAGYLVVAPNHRDAMANGRSGGPVRPEVPFQDPERWNDTTIRIGRRTFVTCSPLSRAALASRR